MTRLTAITTVIFLALSTGAAQGLSFSVASDSIIKEDTRTIKRVPEYERLKTYFHIRRVTSLRSHGFRHVSILLKPKSPSTLDLVVWSSIKSENTKQADLDWEEFFNAYSEVSKVVEAHRWLKIWKTKDQQRHTLRWTASTGEVTSKWRMMTQEIEECWQACRLHGRPEHRIELNILSKSVQAGKTDNKSDYAYLSSAEANLMLWPQSWFDEYADYKKLEARLQNRDRSKTKVVAAVVSPNGDRRYTQW